MFTITGYYSPLPGQSYYVTGSYESEIRLNGQGIAGADGTPVYSGMIAAPYSYAYKTIICFPNLGCGKIHDRGGAIVEKGKTTLARNDRIDIWTGYGDAGLRNALALGVKDIEGEIFPETANKTIGMKFELPATLEEIVDIPEKPIFDTNLSLGMKGEKVKQLQETLQSFGFWEEKITDTFDEKLKKTLIKFQIKKMIIENETQNGAGIFGPQTRAKTSILLYKNLIEEKMRESWEKFQFETELKSGERSPEVARLQEKLIKMELLNVAPTGFFGQQTKDSLIQFQIKEKIIKTEKDTGAGNFGPKTKDRLNEILTAQNKKRTEEKKQLLNLQKTQQKLFELTSETLVAKQ